MCLPVKLRASPHVLNHGGAAASACFHLRHRHIFIILSSFA
jgi:hypothetical protein